MRTINAKLNTNDINNAIEQVKQFQSDLQSKLEQFVSELADVGIEIAKQNIIVEEDESLIDRSGLVAFSKDVTGDIEGATCIIVATPTPYTTHWKKSKNGQEVFSAEVNPLLMAEFGSGANAIGGHRGTFPNQKNANRTPWVWYDVEGNKHYSSGNTPSRPLFKAVQEMENQIAAVAERVFGS